VSISLSWHLDQACLSGVKQIKTYSLLGMVETEFFRLRPATGLSGDWFRSPSSEGKCGDAVADCNQPDQSTNLQTRIPKRVPRESMPSRTKQRASPAENM